MDSNDVLRKMLRANLHQRQYAELKPVWHAGVCECNCKRLLSLPCRCLYHLCGLGAAYLHPLWLCIFMYCNEVLKASGLLQSNRSTLTPALHLHRFAAVCLQVLKILQVLNESGLLRSEHLDILWAATEAEGTFDVVKSNVFTMIEELAGNLSQ
eukprot:1133400-Pelagomonas_calceolata.AAC.6